MKQSKEDRDDSGRSSYQVSVVILKRITMSLDSQEGDEARSFRGQTQTLIRKLKIKIKLTNSWQDILFRNPEKSINNVYCF